MPGSFPRQVFDVREVQQLSDALQRRTRQIDEDLLLSFGAPTKIIHTDYQARVGELVLLDPSEGPLTVTLPGTTTEDVGRGITLINVGTSTSTVTVQAPGVSTINGVASVAVSGAFFVRQVMAAGLTQYLLTAARDGGVAVEGLPQPWFEWNGVDTSQFGALGNGSGVTASSVAVVSAFGVNWLEITVTNDGNNRTNLSTYEASMPISATPPSKSYAVLADTYVGTFHPYAAGIRYSMGLQARHTPAAGIGESFLGRHYRDGPAATNAFASTQYVAPGAGSVETPMSIASVTARITDTNDISRMRLDVTIGSHVELESDGRRTGGLNSNLASTVGGAALVCGNARCLTAGTGKYRFRNIRCYSLPREVD